MAPTLRDGDVVLVDIRAYDGTSPIDGDIVVARHPHQQIDIVKRVEFVDDGVYLRGDNRHEVEAQDSRSFGTIPADGLVGKVTSIVRAR